MPGGSSTRSYPCEGLALFIADKVNANHTVSSFRKRIVKNGL